MRDVFCENTVALAVIVCFGLDALISIWLDETFDTNIVPVFKPEFVRLASVPVAKRRTELLDPSLSYTYKLAIPNEELESPSPTRLTGGVKKDPSNMTIFAEEVAVFPTVKDPV